jgi:hypothetical protein
MNAGALGLSAASNTRLAATAATGKWWRSQIAAASGSVYMTHIRDEADKSFEALQGK